MSKSIVVQPGDFNVLFRSRCYYRHEIPIAFRPLCKLEPSKEPGFRFVGAKADVFDPGHPNSTEGWITKIPQVTDQQVMFPKVVGYNDELVIRDLTLTIDNGTLAIKGKGEIAENIFKGFPVALFLGVHPWGGSSEEAAYFKPDEQRGEYNTNVDGGGHFEFLAKMPLDVSDRIERFLCLNVHNCREIIGDGDQWAFGLPLPSTAFRDFCGSLDSSFIKYQETTAKKLWMLFLFRCGLPVRISIPPLP